MDLERTVDEQTVNCITKARDLWLSGKKGKASQEAVTSCFLKLSKL